MELGYVIIIRREARMATVAGPRSLSRAGKLPLHRMDTMCSATLAATSFIPPMPLPTPSIASLSETMADGQPLVTLVPRL